MPGNGRPPRTATVWDPVVRVLHWTLATAFVGAYALEDMRNLHQTLGWIAAAAVLLRLIWGFTGTAHARFADFVPTPGRLLRYAGAAVRGTEPRYVGHNPAGGAMVVALLSAVAVLAVTGWMMGLDAFWGVDWVEALHEGAANVGLALVCLHLAGVAWESLRHRENLVKAMITGRKRT